MLYLSGSLQLLEEGCVYSNDFFMTVKSVKLTMMGQYESHIWSNIFKDKNFFISHENT